MIKAIKYILFAVLLGACLYQVAMSDEVSQDIKTKELEKQVSEVLKKDNVDMRHEIGVVYVLIDLYLDKHDYAKALSLYEKALEVDSWNLERQLQFAYLLNQNNRKADAVEKANIVYQYAEDKKLIDDAEAFLGILKINIPKKQSTIVKVNRNIEIVLVPIGEINMRLLNELKDKLQEALGIEFIITEKVLELGAVDRTYASKYITDIIENIKSQVPEEEFNKMTAEAGVTQNSLETFDGGLKLIAVAYASKGALQEDIDKFNKQMQKWQLEGKGQYDASRLQNSLREKYPLIPNSKVKGYLGITEGDMFAKDHNFLFGWAGEGYGVVSYARFKADFYKEPPNRPRLLDRTTKQAISSSYFILGIPRCTNPVCVRAYPHSLEEHDQKSLKLCSSCKTQLDNYIKNNQPKWKFDSGILVVSAIAVLSVLLILFLIKVSRQRNPPI